MLRPFMQRVVISAPIVFSFARCSFGDDIKTDKLKCGAEFIGRENRGKNQVILLNCGSFNPPTYMHLRMMEVASSYLTKSGWDVLGGYLSPVHDGYKKPHLASSEDRRQMCKLAVKESQQLMVDYWESTRDEYQNTINVLRHLKMQLEQKMPQQGCDIKIMIVCGSDLLESFCKPDIWDPAHVEEILRDHGAICIEREGAQVNSLLQVPDTLLNAYKDNVLVVSDPAAYNNISSSKVREAIKEGFSIKYLVPDEVINYIKYNNLYAD